MKAFGEVGRVPVHRLALLLGKGLCPRRISVDSRSTATVDGGVNRLLAPIDEKLIRAVVANPEPHEVSATLYCQGSHAVVHTCRPKPPGFFKMQRRM